MKKIILALMVLLFYIVSPVGAFERAAPMDFIFKGGDYKETITMVIDAPITARIEGDDGAIFYLDAKCGCELRHTGTDENGIETYSAAPGSIKLRSNKDHMNLNTFSAGLIYEPVTSSLAWFISSSGSHSPNKRWTKELTDAEYQLIGFQNTITAEVGTNAILVQYAGVLSGANDIIIEITDADGPETLIQKILDHKKIPGYFQIPGGGILNIEMIEKVDGVSFLNYEWVKEPPL